MQFLQLFLLFAVFCCNTGLSKAESLKCYRCGTALKPDAPAAECSNSQAFSKCITGAGFDQCYTRFVTKVHKHTNKTEIVLSKGCGLSSFCTKICDPKLFVNYTLVSCNTTCCTTSDCNDFKFFPPTPPALSTLVMTTSVMTTGISSANETAQSPGSTAHPCNAGIEPLKEHALLMMASMLLLIVFSVFVMMQ